MFKIYGIILLGFFLFGHSVVYAGEEERGVFLREAPEISQPSFDDSEEVSRLSEKYIIGTISDIELKELQEKNGDFNSLDRYKIEYKLSQEEKKRSIDLQKDTKISDNQITTTLAPEQSKIINTVIDKKEGGNNYFILSCIAIGNIVLFLLIFLYFSKKMHNIRKEIGGLRK